MATFAITPDQDVVSCEIFIAAPPARVFEAITDPRQLPQWWGQKEAYRVTNFESDLRVHGKWKSTVVSANGDTKEVSGEYLEVDPPRLLVQTWVPSYAHNLKTIVRWELEPQSVHGLHPSGPQRAGTGTLVKIQHSGFAGHAEQAKSHGQGWGRVLAWAQAFIEKGQTIDSRN
ncbi:MAG: SRPBCC domain-containing protein [Candidatus Sulfotelmatobacter sp.]